VNRCAAFRNRDRVVPIYDGADGDACPALFRPHDLSAWFAEMPGLRARFWKAVHLLGSASVEIELAQAGRAAPKVSVLGRHRTRSKADARRPGRADRLDYLMSESTMAIRPHRCQRRALPHPAARRGACGNAPERRIADPLLRR
jgi:metallo-beta-lactamase family protein